MSGPIKPMSSGVRAHFTLLVVALILGYLGRPPSETVSTSGADSSGTAELVESEGQQGEQVLTPEEAQAQAASASSTTKKSTSSKAAPAGISCAAGRNGGKTDIGVSSTRIRLATTAVLDGPAASLLKDSPTAMKAVIDKVNAAGGICGRRLDLPASRVVNDSFRADLGHTYIKNFLDPQADIFALPVVPSAEGLASAIKSKDISATGMPVVGTDGMRIDQYQDPFVWPVAAATVSTMRIIADYAFKVEKADTFAIVWDSKYKFGVEGRDAFRQRVEALGGKIQADVPLDPDLSSYSSQIADFNSPEKCGSQACKAVVMLLLPDTAKLWLSGQPEMGRLYTAGAQTLFTTDFAEACVNAMGNLCNGFSVWTGYNPPIGTYATLPGVSTYVSDVKRISQTIDEQNQFVEGAYFGMSLFVEALKKVGPFLTRQRLGEVLDSLDHKSDFASDLSWRPGKHNANARARSFSMLVSDEKFKGWADERTGWVVDPAVGG